MPFRDTFDPGGPDGRLSRGDSNTVPGWGSHRLQSPGWHDSAAQGCLCSALPGTHGEAAGVPRWGPFLLSHFCSKDPLSARSEVHACNPSARGIQGWPRLRETLSHCPPAQMVPLRPHYTIGFCTLTDTQFPLSVCQVPQLSEAGCDSASSLGTQNGPPFPLSSQCAPYLCLSKYLPLKV